MTPTPASNLSDEQIIDEARKHATAHVRDSVLTAFARAVIALDRARATAEPVAMHRWFDAMTKDRCDCVFETALVTRWIDELLTGKPYIPGPGATVAPSPAPTVDPNEIDHPTNRYLFKQMLHKHGIALGENIADALKKLHAGASPEPTAEALEKENETLRLHIQRLTKQRDALADIADPIEPPSDHQVEAPIQLPDVNGAV